MTPQNEMEQAIRELEKRAEDGDNIAASFLFERATEYLENIKRRAANYDPTQKKPEAMTVPELIKTRRRLEDELRYRSLENAEAQVPFNVGEAVMLEVRGRWERGIIHELSTTWREDGQTEAVVRVRHHLKNSDRLSAPVYRFWKPETVEDFKTKFTQPRGESDTFHGIVSVEDFNAAAYELEQEPKQ
jgi:hypothetical protein